MLTFDQFLTTPEAARRLDVDRATLWRWATTGRGPVRPLGRVGRGGVLVFDADAVERAAAERAGDQLADTMT